MRLSELCRKFRNGGLAYTAGWRNELRDATKAIGLSTEVASRGGVVGGGVLLDAKEQVTDDALVFRRLGLLVELIEQRGALLVNRIGKHLGQLVIVVFLPFGGLAD